MEVAAPRPRGRWRDVLEERRFLAAVLIGPAVLFIAVLVGGPLLLAIYLSLTDATAGSLTGEFVGLRNFTEAWESPNFRRALRNTVIFTVISQVIVLLVAGVLAHALAKPFPGAGSSASSSCCRGRLRSRSARSASSGSSTRSSAS